MAFICFVHSVYSQNKYDVYNSNKTKYQRIETSSELKMSNFGDHHFVYHKDIKKNPSITKSNYEFKLNIEGDWWSMAIGNGDDFFDMTYQFFGDTYEEIVPEGYYDITISGYTPEGGPAFIFYEQVLINQNTELNANMNDAVHKVEIVPVDMNGNPLSDVELLDSEIAFYLFMHHTIGMTFQNTYGGFFPDIELYVNDMGTRNKLLITVDLLTTDGDHYFYTMPMIEDGLTGNIVLTNQKNEVLHYEQKFNISKELTEDTYSNMSYIHIFYDFDTEEHGYIMTGSAWSIYRPHDKDKPYSLYTNVKYNDTPETGDMNLFISPIFWEFFDIYGHTDYSGSVISMPIAINKNGELILNAHTVLSDWAFNDGEGIELTLGKSPLARVWNKEEFYYEGYRTPHLYYQPSNFNATTSPWGFAFVRGGLLFQGEFNEQKYNHGDVTVKITGDGTVVFNDSIFKFNDAWDIDATKSQYEMEITNDQIFAFGINMVNRSRINFDLSKADANPPALTMLRVIDNEKISMSVLNPQTARLEITAGDFTQDDEKYWALKYVGKPNMEVWYSYNDATVIYELPVVEDVSKFHPSYGNFFEVSLASLAEVVGMNVAWITVSIVLTDEAGNKIAQIFEPLFLYGEKVGINEQVQMQKNHLIYPNPFTDRITIEFEQPLSGETYFEVYDVAGRIIHQQKMSCDHTNSFTWNGSHLTGGVYFYGIYNQGNAYRGKIVKQ